MDNVHLKLYVYYILIFKHFLKGRKIYETIRSDILSRQEIHINTNILTKSGKWTKSSPSNFPMINKCGRIFHLPNSLRFVHQRNAHFLDFSP